MEALNDVEDFLDRQGDIVVALAVAEHAEEVYQSAVHSGHPLSSLLMKSLDAKLLRIEANRLVTGYDANV